MYPHSSFFISKLSARLLQNCRLSLLRLEKKIWCLIFPFNDIASCRMRAAPVVFIYNPLSQNPHVPVGHVPVGQESLPLLLCPTANPENNFCVSVLPHFSQMCLFLPPLFSRNSILCPHLLHLYSNIGIVISPVNSQKILLKNSFLNTTSNLSLNYSMEPSTRRFMSIEKDGNGVECFMDTPTL